MSSLSDEQKLRDEVTHLQSELSLVRDQLKHATFAPSSLTNILPSHPLLLLTDSALPLGSFAFSSGLESYLTHHGPARNHFASTLSHFLVLSLRSCASTSLPFLIAAFKFPNRLQELDSELDACILCPVAKRASVAQGRALLTLWERALRSGSEPSSSAIQALADFSAAMKSRAPGPSLAVEEDDNEEERFSAPQAHFASIYATVCAAMGMSLSETAYTYLFNHAKAVVSAGVRASVTGPYAAQSILGSMRLRGEIEEAMATGWEKQVEEAGQSVVVMDVWIGRHELLYSRIFNS